MSGEGLGETARLGQGKGRSFAVLVLIALTELLIACGSISCGGSTSSSDSAGAGGLSGPCDPLSPPPTKIGAVLGVGEDTQSATFYVADESPDSGGQDRVFVSHGTTLDRQHVAGSGQSGGPPNADYSFSFQPPFADAGDVRALLIQVRSGALTAMALGPGTSRSFLGSGPGQVPLAVVDAGAVAGFKIQNLPNVVQYVMDVSNGQVVVITEPMDAWGYSGFRVFYGAAGQMVERPVVTYNQSRSGPADISFSVGSATYTLHTTVVFGPDAGPLGSPGPATVDTGGGGTLAAALRLPTPPSLSGFSFTCLE